MLCFGTRVDAQPSRKKHVSWLCFAVTAVGYHTAIGDDLEKISYASTSALAGLISFDKA